MKLRTKLLSFTAAIALSAGMAFAAIDGNALADKYLKDGYTYVEVKVGLTQTKVEAVKGDTMIEVIYDNETGKIIESETQGVDDDYADRKGKDVKTVDKDFTDSDDDEGDDEDGDDDEGDDDEGDDDEGDDDEGDDDEGDDDDDDDDDDDEDDGESDDEDDGEDGEGDDA